jgi:hypothetical protein
MVTLAQDYCGLALRSKEPSYRGDLVFDTYVKDGCLWRAISHFVPMIPIPRNVLLSEAQLKQAIVGLTLTYACATGERSVQVSEQNTFIMPVTPTVLVRKSSTVANALEYRLAVGVVVAMGSDSPLAWTIYVDGLDGTVPCCVFQLHSLHSRSGQASPGRKEGDSGSLLSGRRLTPAQAPGCPIGAMAATTRSTCRITRPETEVCPLNTAPSGVRATRVT